MATGRIIELVGIYDADGTLSGEIRYWFGARLGRTHCSLCEITHGLFTTRADWRECRESLGVEFLTFHRNDAPDDVLTVAGGLPAVVARTDRGAVRLLGPDELLVCEGDVGAFRSALHRSVERHRLTGL